jgi:PPP family 3-phenylpropionic acid transporter
MLAVNIIVGRIADRASDWRGVIVALSLLAGSVPLGLFFVSGFWGILLVWTLAIMPAFALVPVIDAATLRMTQRRGTDFAGVRAWGTVGYMATTGLSGPLIDWMGDGAFVPLLCAFALCRALISLQLPQFRASPGEAKPAHSAGAKRLREVLKPWFVLTLLGAGILYSTNSVVSTFAALLWNQQGISAGLIGPLIAVMAAAEASMMFAWKRLRVKISARHLIIIAAVVAAFRWTAMAFSPPIWVLFGLQLLHSITFAVGYFGTVYFIANWTSDDIAAEAQGFSYVLQQAMAVVALVGMGWCVAAFGAWAWAALGAFALLGAGLVWVSLLIKPPTDHPARPPEPIIEPAP